MTTKRHSKAIYHPLHTGPTKCQFCGDVFMSAESARMHEQSRHKKKLAQMRKLLKEMGRTNDHGLTGSTNR